MIKLVLSSVEKLNVTKLETFEPFEDFIAPCVFERTRTQDENGPILSIEVQNGDRLKRLPYTHFITEQKPPIFFYAKCHPILLKLVERFL